MFKLFLDNATSTILMDNSLDPKKFKADFLKIIGVHPESGGLVSLKN
jgi:hypothetical protein